MRNPFEWVSRRYDRALTGARARSGVFDHFWRAKERYESVLGGRLAAAIAYYAFFAVFALALVAYSVLGFALGASSDLKGSVTQYLAANLPWLQVSQIEQSRGTVALIGLAGLVLTGVGWVEGLRSSERLIWGLDEQPGNTVVRRLVDLGILVGLGVLVGLSLWVTGGIERLLFGFTPDQVPPWMQDLLSSASVVLGWVVNLTLAAALIAGVPRLRMPPRRLLPPTLLVAIGITLLTTLGRFIFQRTENNPAYQVASSVVGLLVFLYLFHQLVLFGSAIAATSKHGRVVDLAAGPPAPQPPPPAATPAPTENGSP